MAFESLSKAEDKHAVLDTTVFELIQIALRQATKEGLSGAVLDVAVRHPLFGQVVVSTYVGEDGEARYAETQKEN